MGTTAKTRPLWPDKVSMHLTDWGGGGGREILLRDLVALQYKILHFVVEGGLFNLGQMHHKCISASHPFVDFWSSLIFKRTVSSR